MLGIHRRQVWSQSTHIRGVHRFRHALGACYGLAFVVSSRSSLVPAVQPAVAWLPCETHGRRISHGGGYAVKVAEA